MNYDYHIKAILAGNSGVGKSAFLKKFTDHSFDPTQYDSTIGVEFGCKILKSLKHKVDAKFMCWDPSGQEIFRSITRSYYRGCAIVFLLYDITSQITFNKLTSWINEIHSNSENEEIVIVVVGNKTDLEHRRWVSRAEGEKFARNHNCLFFETSSKSEHVDYIFQAGFDALLYKLHEGQIDLSDTTSGIRIGNNPNSLILTFPKEEKNCCKIF